MSEEEIIDQIPQETPEPEVQEEAPQFDPEAYKAQLEAEYSRKEETLRKGFDEIARRERALAQPTQEEPDALAGVGEADLKVLRAAVDKLYGPKLQAIDEMATELAESRLQSYAKAHDLDPDEVRPYAAQFVGPNGLTSLSAVDKAIEEAAKIVKAQKFDPDSERKRIEEEVLKRLQEQGARVEAIRDFPSTPGSGKADWTDPDLTPEERYRLLSNKE